MLYILFAFVSLSLASCAKTEDAPSIHGQEQLPSYIFFEPKVLDITETKAELLETSLPNASQTAYGVLGYYSDNTQIFVHQDYKNDNGLNIARLYRNGEREDFSYDHLAPWNTGIHTFYAFYPYSLADRVSVSDNIPYISYTQPEKMEGVVDILGCKLFSEKTGMVSIGFKHLLSALKITVTNSQTTEVVLNEEGTKTTYDYPTLTINSIVFSLVDFPLNAQLKFEDNGAPTYSAEATNKTKRTYTIFSGAHKIGASNSQTNSATFTPLLFLPVTGLKYQIIINYTTEGGYNGEYNYSGSSDMVFTKGKVYSLNIKKTNDKLFIGKIELIDSAGAWTDVNVPHTFN